MSYLPRPDSDRTGQDVDDIYALAADDLRKAASPEERRKAFRQALLRAYEGGVDAQRELFHSYPHDRPTPVPAPPTEPDDATPMPGSLPRALPVQPPAGAFKKPKR